MDQGEAEITNLERLERMAEQLEISPDRLLGALLDRGVPRGITWNLQTWENHFKAHGMEPFQVASLLQGGDLPKDLVQDLQILAFQQGLDWWFPACGGCEMPFAFQGRTILYAYHPAKHLHGYLVQGDDRVFRDMNLLEPLEVLV